MLPLPSAHPCCVRAALLTQGSYRNFRLLFEMRLVHSEMHSGLYFWGEKLAYAPDGWETEPYTYKGHLALIPGGDAQTGHWGLFDFYRRSVLLACCPRNSTRFPWVLDLIQTRS